MDNYISEVLRSGRAALIIDEIRKRIVLAGWNVILVDEAVEILDALSSEKAYERQTRVVKSRVEILKNWRYLDYWYFEGAPVSVQAALFLGLQLNLLHPPSDRSDRIAEFQRYFGNQLDFKTALNASEAVGGWLFPGEPEFLWEGVAQTSCLLGDMCEIGSWTGRSTIMLAAARQRFSPKKKFHIVDDWKFGGQPALYPYLSDNRHLRAEFECNLSPWCDRLCIHEGSFEEVYPELVRNCSNGLSLVFHDAGHSPEDFKRDLGLLAPLLLDGGAIFVHDYISKNFKPGQQAIDNWIEENPKFHIEKIVGSCARIRKS